MDQLLEFRQLIQQNHSQNHFTYSTDTVDQLVLFYQQVLKENEIQNLTRLLSPKDFYYGHLIDVVELMNIPWLAYPAMDLGSGVGIPGLLASIIHPGNWVLAESEIQKYEYLQRMVNILHLQERVKVFSGRGENYLSEYPVQSVAARAVASVSKIYTWIRNSSTWNNLILFKGPKWESEWDEFQNTKFRKELEIHSKHFYTVGPEQKKRVIVVLKKVPRETIESKS